VAGAFEAVVNISMALSYVVAGPIVAWLGPRGTYVLGGAISLLAVVAAVPMLEARREPDRGEERKAPTGEAAARLLGDASGSGYPVGPGGASASASPPAAGGSADETDTETTVSTR
jgi:MFS family permease